MNIFRELHNVAIDRPVVTIGIFDGVHLAHQAVIRKLKNTAEEMKAKSTIITLWPHPRIVLKNESDDVRLLNTLQEKIELLEEAGVENLIIIPFNRDFAHTDFDYFVRELLVNKLKMKHLVVGFNHHFGKNRQGNFESLQKLSYEMGFGLSRQDPVLIENEKVSSSIIREYIKMGNLRTANEFLGYRYSARGKVVRGNRMGRELGYPTANISLTDPDKLVPGDGVYAVLVELDNKLLKGMMNIGCRPTLIRDCTESILEVHVFDQRTDMYEKEIKVEFIERIRDEKKFNSADELKIQIARDKEVIKDILSSIIK
jgi:riboflavin kinase/FMN adenylyltransferase